MGGKDIIIVQLPIEPQTSDELLTVAEIVADKGNCDEWRFLKQ